MTKEDVMETETAIREWVQKHRVTWEVGSFQELVCF